MKFNVFKAIAAVLFGPRVTNPQPTPAATIPPTNRRERPIYTLAPGVSIMPRLGGRPCKGWRKEQSLARHLEIARRRRRNA